MKRAILGSCLMILIASFTLLPARDAGGQDCLVCGTAAGVPVCLLAQGAEIGYHNCTAGTICVTRDGEGFICFEDACTQSNLCIAIHLP